MAEGKLTMRDLESRIIAQRVLIDDQGAQIATLTTDLADVRKMVAELHRALMEPQPGYDKGLLQRLALLAVQYEAGGVVGRRVVWLGAVASAAVSIGVAMAALRSGIGGK